MIRYTALISRQNVLFTQGNVNDRTEGNTGPLSPNHSSNLTHIETIAFGILSIVFALIAVIVAGLQLRKMYQVHHSPSNQYELAEQGLCQPRHSSHETTMENPYTINRVARRSKFTLSLPFFHAQHPILSSP
jgi:hypothetical protein